MVHRPRLREVAPFLAYLALWLLPIAWLGGTGKDVPGAGKWLNNQYRVGCLFTIGARFWDTYHVLLRYEGRDDWVQQDPDELSTMRPFGHWTRFDMLLARSVPDYRGLLQRDRMAAYARDRHAALHPEAPRVVAVQFVQAWDLTSDYDYPSGAYAWRPLSQFRKSRQEVLSTHTFDGQLPVDGKRGATSPARWEALGACKR